MFNANDSSMNGTCNTYVQYTTTTTTTTSIQYTVQYSKTEMSCQL